MRLWRKRSSLVLHCHTFSICRAHFGAGALHLAISMAVYLGRVWRHHVAVIEMSPDERLLSISSDETVIIGDAIGYRLGEIDIFPGCDMRSVGLITGSQYDYVIVVYGFGADEPLLPADTQRFCITSTRSWYFHDAADMIKYYLSAGYRCLDCLAVCPTHHERLRFQSEFGLHLISIPYIDDPFSLCEDDMIFLKKLTNCG